MAAPLGTAPVAPAPVTLHLVRHGVAVGAAGRCIGHTDLPLAPSAHATLQRRADEWTAPHRPRLVSSDLARARESAALLAERWGLPLAIPVDPRLREMDFGQWDGRTWADLERDEPAAFGAWMARWQDARTPGGEGFPDVIARVAAWMRDTIAAAHADGVTDVVAVAHAGSIRALLVHAVGIPRDVVFRMRIDHACVTVVSEGGEVRWLNGGWERDASA